jgi:hypothetical protein
VAAAGAPENDRDSPGSVVHAWGSRVLLGMKVIAWQLNRLARSTFVVLLDQSKRAPWAVDPHAAHRWATEELALPLYECAGPECSHVPVWKP